ncbi:hypothetical protein [Fischerella thermalis]|uniref:hypothetical protein n=1 Tax=Fischerella thermalis TaxID=372787 RepID=UPI0011AF1BB5|nr:hypothetical protein [Fischerella thermalis]
MAKFILLHLLHKGLSGDFGERDWTPECDRICFAMPNNLNTIEGTLAKTSKLCRTNPDICSFEKSENKLKARHCRAYAFHLHLQSFN